MIDTILADVKTPIRLYLFTPHAAADDPSVYFKSRIDSGTIESRSQAELAAEQNESFPINFGDVRWTMVVVPEGTGLISAGGERAFLLLICGLLLSGGLTSFVWAMRRANGKFEKKNFQFHAALNNMVQGLLMYDPAGKLIISNRRFAELMGMPWEKWDISALGTTVPQGMQLLDDLTNITIKNHTQLSAELQSILGQHRTGSLIIERSDGRTLSATCMPMTDGGFVVTFEDITQRRRVEKEISHMAHYDALTDLPNRVLFYEKMGELLTRAPQCATFALLSLDLDHFKNVNDTLGHPAGDKLLHAVAERIRGCIRNSDIAVRLGGDEFAIVQVTFLQLADVISLATRLIDDVGAPYQIDGHQVVVGISVGIAIAPRDGTDTDQLIKKADVALYRAKSDGGSVYRFFETQIDDLMPERRTVLAPHDGPAKAIA
jgi:diguanylate cyclase (GGDEF)-like protein